jgi:hypothetical protein
VDRTDVLQAAVGSNSLENIAHVDQPVVMNAFEFLSLIELEISRLKS